MKKTLLTASLLAMPLLATSQIFQEDFDGNGPGIGAWTKIDVDGLPHAEAVAQYDASAWIRVDRGGPTPNYGGPDGNYAAASSSWYDPAGTSNDWLISPAIAIPAGGADLSWEAKAQDPDFRDGYKVMLAPNGGNTVADFTVTLYSTAAENGAWIKRTASLADYAGTSVRIAFVNNSTDKFVLLLDNILVKDIPTEAPGCPTLTSPANSTTGVDYNVPLSLKWTAATTGGEASAYDVYLDTNPDPTTLLGSTSEMSYNVLNLEADKTYYWKVVPKNSVGAATGCTVFSFTTMANPFAPYCGPLNFTSKTEPITLVNFAGINNVTPAATSNTEGHQDFINIKGNVSAGNTYTIKLQGNTSGNFKNNFVVFIDWNQNGILDDAGEVYQVPTALQNSTGTDGKEVTMDIAVPADAVAGSTRMRVKKIFGSTNLLNPCMGASYGQAEDYTVNVGTLGTSEANLQNLNVYPNPVLDVLNIDSDSKVSGVTVYDLTGKAVSSHTMAAQKNQINLSKLSPGVYVVTVQTEAGSKTVKILKK